MMMILLMNRSSTVSVDPDPAAYGESLPPVFIYH